MNFKQNYVKIIEETGSLNKEIIEYVSHLNLDLPQELDINDCFIIISTYPMLDIKPETIIKMTEISEKLLSMESVDPLAQVVRAYLHYYGLGGNRDLSEAKRLFLRAISKENRNGLLGYAKALEASGSFGDAIIFYEELIRLGHVDAMCRRARVLEKGLGGEVDHAAAIELYERAIALGNGNAMVKRAEMHQKGLGARVNHAAAIALYERAIALSNADAMVKRAWMHRQGLGGAVNHAA
ncbi:MAG: tetratricopeptide repeat family protein, partial [Gammaproteobacteria bacterium]|nr:tetratricopeptide repeat family protein [Gammaproteobacteria bacterium]